MSIRRTIGSIFGGLVLIAGGGLLLARNFGYPIPVWSGIAVYWPVLLIIWGLLKLLDCYRFKRAGLNRSLFSGGEVALLILVVLAGSALTTAANISPDIGAIFKIGDLDLWDITGNSYEYDEHEESDVPAGSTIEILNLYGNVDIRPSDSDRVVLEVKKTVRASSKEEADARAGEFTFSIKNESSRYRIISSRDESGTARRQLFKSSLTIQVPRQSAVQIDNRNGRVTIQDLTGSQHIVNRFGPTEIRRIVGGLDLENRNGNVTVEDVTESARIVNSFSDTTAKNVGGNLELDNRNGSVEVSGVKGNATISNSFASIKIENVAGDLKVSGRNNSIEVEQVQGNVNADASFQDVSIRDAKGAVTVKARNGDVLLGFTAPPQNDISVSGQFSNITLELPSMTSFSIEGRTAFGSIESEFDGVRTTSTNRERFLKGQIGQGGPQINIDTRNGDIRLEKKG